MRMYAMYAMYVMYVMYDGGAAEEEEAVTLVSRTTYEETEYSFALTRPIRALANDITAYLYGDSISYAVHTYVVLVGR